MLNYDEEMHAFLKPHLVNLLIQDFINDRILFQIEEVGHIRIESLGLRLNNWHLIVDLIGFPREEATGAKQMSRAYLKNGFCSVWALWLG